MQVEDIHDLDDRLSSASDHGDTGSSHLLSAKLLDKLDKLAKWRIDRSSISFPKNTREFRGGHATVSRAFLSSNEAEGSDMSDSGNAGEGHESRSKTLRQKVVAVKALKVEGENDRERVLGRPESFQLALREAEFLVKLSHINIIYLEGFVEDLPGNKIWLIFPWEEHGNLKDFAASQDWEIPERIWLIDDVARGVEYLHTQDPPICHGDLKSVNILVNSEFRAVITDFGSARLLSNKDPGMEVAERVESTPTPALVLDATICAATNTITLTGNKYTLRWAAPELLTDDEPGLWSDIWALGWVFYEVMTNSIPFQNVQKDSMVIKQVIRGDLPEVTTHTRMSLMLGLCSLMVRCWSINPSERPTAEGCRKSMDWMPMITPNPQRTSDTGISKPLSAELLVTLGDMYIDQTDHVNAWKAYTEALGIHTEVHDSSSRADALFGLAEVHRFRDEYKEAAAYYSEVAQIHADNDEKQGGARALLGLASVSNLQNDNSKAFTLYSQALQVFTDINDQQGRAEALFGLGQLHRHQREFTQAVALFSDSLQAYTDVGDRKGRAHALVGLAQVHRLEKEYTEAVNLYSEALQLYNDLGDKKGRADALFNLAELNRHQQDYSQAAALVSESLQICIDIGDRQGRALALLCLADLHRDEDRHSDAISLYEQAAEVYRQIGNTSEVVKVLKRAGRVRWKLYSTGAE